MASSSSSKKDEILSKVPLPDTFFSIKHQLRPIAPIRVSAPSAIFIYLLTIGGFAGCCSFYSLPNPPQTVTVIQSEWQKEGYECKPLQKDQIYGLMHSYDECKAKILPASAATLSLVNDTYVKLWHYKPFADSVLDSRSPMPPLYAKFPSTTADVFTAIKTPAQLSDGSCFEGTFTKYKSFGSILLVFEILEGWCDVAEDPECTKLATTNQLCINKETAIKVYNALNDKYSLCDYFKTNAPFQCTETTVTYKSGLEILSLSVANTQLLFGTLTALFATLFYKLKKDAKIKSMSDETTWQDAVKALQQEIQELKRNKVDKCADARNSWEITNPVFGVGGKTDKV